MEAARNGRTISQIASENNLHPNQVSNWKKQLLSEGKALFERKNNRHQKEQAAREAALYEQIGRLKMELDYVFSWEISNTLDGAFCLVALDGALDR